ncbi:hypothetical protein B8V81_1229 [Paenibacillus pasadenensis]|uniref:Uncharacterized protein n=1 Tax=Paenibacillus pasadenensis TaxID=217090 RepID=A0A2N5N9L0_9BACL|nr:hypothetical protein B8V81_1229 [Paenibacillus pasadenensis]
MHMQVHESFAPAHPAPPSDAAPPLRGPSPHGFGSGGALGHICSLFLSILS